MIKDFTDGVSAFIKAIGQISKFKLWPYVLLSGMISLAIGGSLFYSSYTFASTAGGWISSFYKWDFASGVIQTMANWISGFAIIAGGFMIFKYVILIVLSPIMSLVSDKVESQILGKRDKTSFSIGQIIKDLLRGLSISLRNLSKELLIMFVLFILSLVPGFGIVTAPLLFLTQVYYVGFGNMDYCMERHFNVKGASTFVKQHRGLAIANGMLFTGLLFIPILGLFLAPILATISSTVTVLDRLPRLDTDPQIDFV